MPKTERQTHTPADRATAALGVEQRRVDKLEAKRKAHMTAVQEINAELTSATARRDYLAQHPDLPANHTQPIPEVDATVAPPTAGRRGTGRAGRAVTDSPQA